MEIHELKTPFTPQGSGVHRSHLPGTVHLTDVMRYIDGALDLGNYGGSGTKCWHLDVAAEIGFIWEDVLSEAFATRCALRLPEQQRGPIIFSPDGFGEDPGVWDEQKGEWIVEPDKDEPVLEEYKCTWMSVKRHPLDIWRYKIQAQGYLYGLGLKTVVYRILHLMGDYAGSGPLYRTVRISYNTELDQEELRMNWEMLETYATRMLERGYDGTFDCNA